MDYKQKYLKYKKKYIDLKNQLGGNKDLEKEYVDCIKTNYKDCELIKKNTQEGDCTYKLINNSFAKICKKDNNITVEL